MVVLLRLFPVRSTDHGSLRSQLAYLEKPGLFVRILFIQFSFAFKTIQPHLMTCKRLKLDINPRLNLWIVDILVYRSQTIRHQAALLSSRSFSTGSPQSTVLSPILFTLYTNDSTGTDTKPIIKYSDGSAVEELSNSDSVYFVGVERFSKWCRNNFLDLNINKTKEMFKPSSHSRSLY